MVSLSISSRFPVNTAEIAENPVIFPPGRARLSTSPAATGSDTAPKKTMGIVLVAFLSAEAPFAPDVTSKSTLRRTNSLARPGSGQAYLPRIFLDRYVLALNIAQRAEFSQK